MNSNKIKQFVSGQELKASDLQDLSNAITRAMPSDASNTTRGSMGFKRRFPVVGGGGLVLDERVCFGHTIAANIVTIYVGYLQHGKRLPIRIPSFNPNTSITITADHQFIPIHYTYGSGYATIGGPTTTMPYPETGIFHGWLYKFRLIAGIASLDTPGVGLGGNYILIPGAFA